MVNVGVFEKLHTINSLSSLQGNRPGCVVVVALASECALISGSTSQAMIATESALPAAVAGNSSLPQMVGWELDGHAPPPGSRQTRAETAP
jgi:hypothetical protein